MIVNGLCEMRACPVTGPRPARVRHRFHACPTSPAPARPGKPEPALARNRPRQPHSLHHGSQVAPRNRPNRPPRPTHATPEPMSVTLYSLDSLECHTHWFSRPSTPGPGGPVWVECAALGSLGGEGQDRWVVSVWVVGGRPGCEQGEGRHFVNRCTKAYLETTTSADAGSYRRLDPNPESPTQERCRDAQ